jgi:hypothetical protein
VKLPLVLLAVGTLVLVAAASWRYRARAQVRDREQAALYGTRERVEELGAMLGDLVDIEAVRIEVDRELRRAEALSGADPELSFAFARIDAANVGPIRIDSRQGAFYLLGTAPASEAVDGWLKAQRVSTGPSFTGSPPEVRFSIQLAEEDLGR